MLDPVDPVAALDRPCHRAERRLAGSGGAVRLGKGLGEQHALLDDAAEQGLAPAVVPGAHGIGHVEFVGQARCPEQGGGVHVEGQRRGRAPAAQFGRDQGVSPVVGAHAAMLFRDRQGEKAGFAQVGIILERKQVPGVQFGGARAEPVAPQLADAADQVFLAGGRVRPMDVHERLRHAASLIPVRFLPGYGLQETADLGVESRRIFHIGDMACIGQATIAGAGDGLGHPRQIGLTVEVAEAMQKERGVRPRPGLDTERNRRRRDGGRLLQSLKAHAARSPCSTPRSTTVRPSSDTVQWRSGRSKWPSVCRPATSFAPVE